MVSVRLLVGQFFARDRGPFKGLPLHCLDRGPRVERLVWPHSHQRSLSFVAKTDRIEVEKRWAGMGGQQNNVVRCS